MKWGSDGILCGAGQVGTDRKSVTILPTEFKCFVVHPFQLDEATIGSAGKL